MEGYILQWLDKAERLKKSTDNQTAIIQEHYHQTIILTALHIQLTTTIPV